MRAIAFLAILVSSSCFASDIYIPEHLSKQNKHNYFNSSSSPYLHPGYINHPDHEHYPYIIRPELAYQENCFSDRRGGIKTCVNDPRFVKQWSVKNTEKNHCSDDECLYQVESGKAYIDGQSWIKFQRAPYEKILSLDVFSLDPSLSAEIITTSSTGALIALYALGNTGDNSDAQKVKGVIGFTVAGNKEGYDPLYGRAKKDIKIPHPSYRDHYNKYIKWHNSQYRTNPYVQYSEPRYYRSDYQPEYIYPESDKEWCDYDYKVGAYRCGPLDCMKATSDGKNHDICNLYSPG